MDALQKQVWVASWLVIDYFIWNKFVIGEIKSRDKEEESWTTGGSIVCEWCHRLGVYWAMNIIMLQL